MGYTIFVSQLIFLGLLGQVRGLGNENFTYSLKDNLTIPYQTTVDISNSLTIALSEYVSDGQI